MPGLRSIVPVGGAQGSLRGLLCPPDTDGNGQVPVTAMWPKRYADGWWGWGIFATADPTLWGLIIFSLRGIPYRLRRGRYYGGGWKR